jgi:uncharacterized phage protein (TIGR01671 family)
MREIKFRAWGTRSHTWLDWGKGYLKQIDDNDQDTILTFLPVMEAGYIVMQYTGLKDKNGVEIYEGDLYTMPSHGRKVHVYEVTWHRSGFIIPDVKYVEVIGNIYENPELLKGEPTDE